ncbi:unnamed protein product [Leptosia nina]|uniref:Uncharacterized protein n=1 Tax=Leptosia nina TaxID=320188 RepID=A0AAV1J0G1_9NEOP
MTLVIHNRSKPTPRHTIERALRERQRSASDRVLSRAPVDESPLRTIASRTADGSLDSAHSTCATSDTRRKDGEENDMQPREKEMHRKQGERGESCQGHVTNASAARLNRASNHYQAIYSANCLHRYPHAVPTRRIIPIISLARDAPGDGTDRIHLYGKQIPSYG